MPKNKVEEGASNKRNGTKPAEGNLVWFAIALIAGTAIIIWLVNALIPSERGLPDDVLVRKVVRDQFKAFFDQDKERFLSLYSKDFDNGDFTYEDKAAVLDELDEVSFEVWDFYLEFIKSGEDEADVHISQERGFAGTYAYAYWKQRGGDKITTHTVQKLTAFLLRKEGKQWRIISDKSIPLKQREDAEHLIPTSHFRPFMDPATITWPPPEIEKPPPEPEPAPDEEPEQEQEESVVGGGTGGEPPEG
jgi:hypothetical protein